jgi:hypothetical protein
MAAFARGFPQDSLQGVVLREQAGRRGRGECGVSSADRGVSAAGGVVCNSPTAKGHVAPERWSLPLGGGKENRPLIAGMGGLASSVVRKP